MSQESFEFVTPVPTKRKRGGPFIDRTGQRFGKLVALHRVEGSSKPIKFLCRCDCGKLKAIISSCLGSGVTTDCGCEQRHAKINLTHGQTRTREYGIWASMKARCSNPNCQNYDRYGGRGIKVCERWSASFEAFFSDMGIAPAGHSINRKNNDGDYEPGNCEWANAFEQCANQSTNRMLTVNGETHHVTEWARRVGLSKITLFGRLRAGWDDAQAVLTPARRRKSPSV